MTHFRIVERSARDQLGEGPIWVARLGRLFWVDILGRRLWSLNLADDTVQSWEMPEPIGWIVERDGRDDFLIGLASGIAGLTLEPFAITPLIAPESDRPDNRLNDAKVDAQGQLWFGTKSDTNPQSKGALYRLDRDLAVTRHDDGYGVTNGPTFSMDGRWLYHTDSDARTIYRFPLGDDGSLGPREEFIHFAPEWGYPDGMTTDSDNGLWIAHWAGGRISRFTPDGALDRSITLPARNVTSACFAGDRLNRLFVTSATVDSEGEAEAGALFEVETGMTGRPATAFAA